jgi:LPXTG-motif cell wall-anchored protein
MAEAEIELRSLSGFPAGCNGEAAKLEMRGNSAGDPSVAPSADTLLSTADSTLDPCSQATLAHPLVISGGSITLSLCATGGPAGYVVVHDLTLLSLFLSPSSSGVAGTTTTPSRSSGVAGIGTVVPSTGAASSLSAPLLGLGVALLLGGWIAIVGATRRRRPPE